MFFNGILEEKKRHQLLKSQGIAMQRVLENRSALREYAVSISKVADSIAPLNHQTDLANRNQFSRYSSRSMELGHLPQLQPVENIPADIDHARALYRQIESEYDNIKKNILPRPHSS